MNSRVTYARRTRNCRSTILINERNNQANGDNQIRKDE